ncbi:nucleotidyltransferase domain-containing protein [Neobacillus muris]|uniref:nucleotidyltransferase domain-containing protein n=1 Tax=Neobacillus muris TaxID=2941334 RepID=UPI00203E10A6|nr:nucleotidyltransferase domain-containing protein [Neobacillus muris]
MREAIVKEMYKLEEQFHIKVCCAVESGSRAWGYPAPDSDYDIRFIYVHKPEWYLSIEEKKEVIERPISEGLDISGWELRKALRLFKKSNPSIMEWLQSTIVYYQSSSLTDKMKKMQPKLFLPKASLFHYINMAKGNCRKNIHGEEAAIKAYLNILRPILAGKWIAAYQSAPPLSFQKLVNHLVDNEKVKMEIHFLLDRKMKGYETALKEQILSVTEFIPISISQLEDSINSLAVWKREHDYTAELNELFRLVLRELWFKNNSSIKKTIL